MSPWTLSIASIKSILTHKPCGLNEIPLKAWKTGLLSDVLLLVYNKALKGDVPTAWKQAEIIPLPRKGNLSLPENYRGISLTSVAAKIYNQTNPLTYQTWYWSTSAGQIKVVFYQARSTVLQILPLHSCDSGSQRA